MGLKLINCEPRHEAFGVWTCIVLLCFFCLQIFCKMKFGGNQGANQGNCLSAMIFDLVHPGVTLPLTTDLHQFNFDKVWDYNCIVKCN